MIMTDAKLTPRRSLHKSFFAVNLLSSSPYRLLMASALLIVAGVLAGDVTARRLDFGWLAKGLAMFDRYRPSEPITVYADDGKTEIGKFAPVRHKPLKFEQISPLMRNAILAAEDPHFYDGSSLDPARVVRAGIQILVAGDEGGRDLTLSQQLARKLSNRQGLPGRIQRWLTAVQLERFYTKEEVIESYANHAWFGGNVYGFAAGAEAYFNKPVGSLTPEEAALLAGVPKSPKQYSPLLDVEAARSRRDQVLDLMGRYGFLSGREVSEAKAASVQLAPTSAYSPHDWQFEYPLEEVRQYLEDRYGALGGLSVYTTINVRAQTEAVKELRDALRRYDRERGVWRSDYDNIGSGAGTLTKQRLDNYQHPQWYQENYQENSYVVGLITRVDPDMNQAWVRFGSYTGVVKSKDMGWSGRQPKEEFKVGDIVEFKITKVWTASRELDVELSQVPETAGALVTLNAKNGEVVAMVGGYDLDADPLDQATAGHETGSTFKPFIYSAAVEWCMTPETALTGVPINRGGWQPRNHDGSLGHRDVPMSVALAQDYNLAAVHVLDTLGIQTGAQMVRRFGVTAPMNPDLQSALGDTPAPLEEMVSAYSTFANRGVRVKPHLIRRVNNSDGKVLEEWEQITYHVSSDYVALTMADMMRVAAEKGAAGGLIKGLGRRPVAGSVGVTGDDADRWFIGYTPTYVTGVWVDNSTRGSRPALSTFVSFMKEFLADKPVEVFEKSPEMPEDIRELCLQRKRWMEEDRAYSLSLSSDNDRPPPAADPPLERITLPPPPGEDLNASKPADSGDRKPEPAAATRPREVEPNKKKGKKGNEDGPQPTLKKGKKGGDEQ
jgi:penicillin-binding protein 1A